MKLPKEIAHYLLQQIDETKNGLFRVVAKEIRDFLEHTNFAGEMQKLLTTVQFEVNTTIRFTPNDGADKKDKQDKNDKGDKQDKNDKAQDKAEKKASNERERPDDDDDDDDLFDPLDDPGVPAADAASVTDVNDPPERRVGLPRPELRTNISVRRDERRKKARSL